jgi:hypothetical protein
MQFEHASSSRVHSLIVPVDTNQYRNALYVSSRRHCHSVTADTLIQLIVHRFLSTHHYGVDCLIGVRHYDLLRSVDVKTSCELLKCQLVTALPFSAALLRHVLIERCTDRRCTLRYISWRWRRASAIARDHGASLLLLMIALCIATVRFCPVTHMFTWLILTANTRTLAPYPQTLVRRYCVYDQNYTTACCS